MAKYDLGAAGSGALSGASIGSVGGPIGSVVGGLIGAAGGLFGSKKKKKKKRSTLDPNQQQINQEQFAGLHGKGPLADIYSFDPQKANALFDQTRAKYAYRDINERAIPSVTGQFRNQGLMQSSYAGDAVARLVRDVQEKLESERSKYLSDLEMNTNEAKRSAVENYQNRTNFDYEKRPPAKKFDVNQFLSTLPGAYEGIQNFAVNSLPGGV